MLMDDVFAVIAEATRRDILVSLRSGDKAVGELVEELGASQPTVSKHLKVLREAGLVTMRAQGQKRFYSLSRKPLLSVAEWLDPFDVVGRAAAVSPDGGNGAGGNGAGGNGAKSGAAASNVSSSQGRGEPGLIPAIGQRPVVTGPLNRGSAASGAGSSGAARTPSGQARPERSPSQVPVGSAAQPDAAGNGQGSPGGPGLPEGSRPQQIGRTIGQAANKAAEVFASLPKLRRRKD